MTKDNIINEIISCNEYKSICSKIDWRLKDDLYQELILILLEKPSEDLERVYKRGYIKWYVLKIITNMSNSVTSEFYRKFKRGFDQLNIDIPNDETKYDHSIDKKIDFILKELDDHINDRNEWYKRTLTKKAIITGCREVSRGTGITPSAISMTVKRKRDQIVEKWNSIK